MPRSSRETMQKHRERIEAAAAGLFKQYGAANVSLAQVMNEVGLTHGGFYKHFNSKEELAGQACRAAFTATAQTRKNLQEAAPDKQSALRIVIEQYLSVSHRERIREGCPTVAFASDVVREPETSPLRREYLSGVLDVVEEFTALHADAGNESRQKALSLYITLVGALTLARAVKDDPLSEEMLAAARAMLLAQMS